MLIIMLLILWYISGIASFIYWWTKDFDLELGDILIVLFIGIFGPIAFPIGWCLHGRNNPPTVIIRKRK